MKRNSEDDEMRDEYDFSQGIRGKYAARYAEGTNVILLEPDLAKIFRDSKSVNAALRTIVRKSGKTAARKRAAKRRRS